MRREIKRIISILLHIILLQCIFILPLLIGIALSPINTTIEFVFSYESINFKYWYYMILYIINCIPTSFGIRYFVEKYKKCWDYSITIYFIQYLMIIIFTKNFVPTLSWIIMNVITCVITIVLSEFLCKQIEMSEISFTNTQLITPIPLKSIEIDHVE